MMSISSPERMLLLFDCPVLSGPGVVVATTVSFTAKVKLLCSFAASTARAPAGPVFVFRRISRCRRTVALEADAMRLSVMVTSTPTVACRPEPTLMKSRGKLRYTSRKSLRRAAYDGVQMVDLTRLRKEASRTVMVDSMIIPLAAGVSVSSLALSN